jgi:hypothetical protein
VARCGIKELQTAAPADPKGTSLHDLVSVQEQDFLSGFLAVKYSHFLQLFRAKSFFFSMMYSLA